MNKGAVNENPRDAQARPPAPDPEDHAVLCNLDLRGELEITYGLLNDRRLAEAYESYASAKRRGPDFAVTYRESLAPGQFAAIRRSSGLTRLHDIAL